ncbi:MAG TPA: hypothetical protein DCZ75_05770 [Geobacter sp.]|nr:hypothetical protein [Geobacter sp.]
MHVLSRFSEPGGLRCSSPSAASTMQAEKSKHKTYRHSSQNHERNRSSLVLPASDAKICGLQCRPGEGNRMHRLQGEPMSTPNLDTEKLRSNEESRVHQQIAFASGLFQGDITIRTVLESLAEGVVIIDSSGVILLANEFAGQMFGYPGRDLIGRPHAVLVPERLREIHKEHMARYFAEPRIRPMGMLLDLVGCRQDGSEFPLEISLSFLETIKGVLVLAFISDITLRKQIETRLRKSEELFRIQVEIVKDYAIFTLDLQGNVLNWNAGAERLKGYRAEEIVGRHFSCFYAEKDRNAGAPEDELKKAADQGQFAEECWRIRKDGSGFWADIVITTLYDESGNPWGFSTVTRDITERKKAEEALSFSEARYRALFRDNPTMIFTVDSEGTILTANPFAASELGYTVDELERQPVLKLLHEDDREAMMKQLQMCLKNPDEVHRWQFRKIRKDGTLLWVEEIAQAVSGLEGGRAVLVVCQNVTERKRAEEALRKSEMKLSKIFHSVPVLIGITTVAEGRCVDMNEKGLQTLGYRREEVIGRSTLELGIWESESVRDQATRILLKEGMVRDMEMHFRGKSGMVFTGVLSAELIEFDGEQYMLSVINDITERKRMEEEIVRLNADLEAFNYTVAHDLRQPLNVISSYCQMIERICRDQLGDECMGYVQGAYDSALRMDRLIGALLNFSRLARVEPRRETVDLSAMAHGVAEGLKQTEPGRQVNFEIADGILANGDASLLRAVLDNLLSNAWKYTGMKEQAVIEFGVRDVDGVPTYFVRDNGAGFNMEDADKLFTPFERLPETENQRGFGIGLSTVERIIGRHGGRVWAEGIPGKGACFYFTLELKLK